MNIIVIVCFTICVIAILAFSALIVLYYRPCIERIESYYRMCQNDYRFLEDNFVALHSDFMDLHNDYKLCEKHVIKLCDEVWGNEPNNDCENDYIPFPD